MKEEDFSKWYHDILEDTNIVDARYPIKGMLIYRKWGLYMIRSMQRYLEDALEAAGHEPFLFPVLIPDDILGKETDHIAGFEEQVFWVTHAGKNPLERKLALRPTSETPIYEMFSLWIRSHTDLPLKTHQSCAVYRYETKHTRPLIRGREFLWNEGHSAHATRADAEENVGEIREIYGKLINEVLCLPYQVNRRPEWDKFPGAIDTFAFDTIMPDGKTLQIATVHNLGQNFSRVFDIKYEDAEGNKEYAWQTSYGPSFGRLLAAMISVHGDEKGLVLPPVIAPVQVVVIPILFKKTEEENTQIIDYARDILKRLKARGFRVEIDLGPEHPGDKYYKWEKKGVSLRIEAGPRDLQAGKAVIARRDSKEKLTVDNADIESKVEELFDSIAGNLRDKAKERFESRLHTAKTPEDFAGSIGNGIVSAGWCGEKGCAEKIEETASILSVGDEAAECVICRNPGKRIVAAKTY